MEVGGGGGGAALCDFGPPHYTRPAGYIPPSYHSPESCDAAYPYCASHGITWGSHDVTLSCAYVYVVQSVFLLPSLQADWLRQL